MIDDNNVDVDQDGWAICDGDCNDDSPYVYPGSVELCGNGVDDNCDGSIDYIDVDGDGWDGCDDDCNDF